MSTTIPPVPCPERATVPSGERAGRIDPRVALLALGNFAVGTDTFVVVGVLPAIARETGVTESLAGQPVTLFSLAYGLSAPSRCSIHPNSIAS